MIQHSTDLDQFYTVYGKGSRRPDGTCRDSMSLVFDDGIEYTVSEAVTISKGFPSKDDIKAIHAVKKAFDGEVLARPFRKQEFSGRSDTGPEPLSELLKRLNDAKPGDFTYKGPERKNRTPGEPVKNPRCCNNPPAPPDPPVIGLSYGSGACSSAKSLLHASGQNLPSTVEQLSFLHDLR